MTILALILLCSLISTGFWIATQFEGSEHFDTSERWVQIRWTKPEDKMILWWVRFYGVRFIPKFWTKPLWSCLPCMGSVHSLWPMLWLGQDMTLWPVVAIGTVGVNYLITIYWSK